MNTTTEVSIYDELSNLMKQNDAPFTNETKAQLESLFSYCSAGMETDSEKFLATLFIKALNKKICSDAINENTYEKKYEVSQIELFNILIAKFPFVKYSQQLINNAIVEVIKQNTEATIIDIGVGLGTQMLNIIELSKNLTQLKKLTIVGIEPFADALVIAEKNILACNEKVNFEIEFVGINEYAEKVDFAAIKNMNGAVIVNASLALHHIQTMEQRNTTLASIKSINPTALFLIEPNVDHFEPDFFKRSENSYQHFICLFKVIDKLDIDNHYKNGLKLFFGREIDDIIGKPESHRFEKHAPATNWIQLLEQNNFKVSNGLLKNDFIAEPGVAIKYHPEGFIGFTFENETALSLIYAN